MTPLVRVYFNSSDPLHEPWSVDTGEGTQEYVTSKVVFSDVQGGTVFDASITDPTRPKAWVEYGNAGLFVYADRISVYGL